MELRERPLDDSTTLVVAKGTLDGGSLAQFTDFVDPILAAGARYIVFDLTHLDTVTSAGLREFVRVGMELAGRRGRLVMHTPSPSVLELFELAGLGALFTICPSREAAIAAVARER